MAKKLPRYTKIENGSLGITLESLIEPEELARFQDRFERLTVNDLPSALQYAMVATTREAQEAMADVVDDVFDNPVPYTRVNPTDLKHTSIRRWNARVPQDKMMGMGSVESRIFVMRKQSAYFKFTLGESIRRPGDIGLSEGYIGVPIMKNLQELQGIRPTREGNMHKNAMATLKRRQSKKTMSRKEWVD
jgi:hypothetical protein